MGRPPTELTEAQKAEIETLAAVLSSEQIADYLGIGRRTFYSLMERDPEVAARYKRGRAKAVGAIAQSLITKARGGDTTAMIFYLKTQAGWRETERIEHHVGDRSGSSGRDALQVLMAKLSAISERQAAGDVLEAVDLSLPAPAILGALTEPAGSGD